MTFNSSTAHAMRQVISCRVSDVGVIILEIYKNLVNVFTNFLYLKYLENRQLQDYTFINVIHFKIFI